MPKHFAKNKGLAAIANKQHKQPSGYGQTHGEHKQQQDGPTKKRRIAKIKWSVVKRMKSIIEFSEEMDFGNSGFFWLALSCPLGSRAVKLYSTLINEINGS